MLKNIINSKELIFQLFKRDFLMQYKKSFIGIGWIFISPIIGIASWVILNSAGILSPGNTGMPFEVYVLLSSSLWGLFMGFYSSSAGTLGAGEGFIMQVKFPHEALLAKQLIHHIAGFLITFLINIVVLLAYGIVPSWGILLFPLAMLPLLFLGTAMGLLISIISVVAKDISQIIGIGLSFVFYITPIVYTMDKAEGVLKTLTEINPLTYLIGGIRDLIVYGRMDSLESFLLITLGVFILFLLALRLFYVSEDKVIEKMI